MHTDFNSETFVVSPKAKDEAKSNEAQFSNQCYQKGFSAIRRDFLSLPLTMIIFLGSVITSANLAVNLYFAKILMNNSALQNIVI